MASRQKVLEAVIASRRRAIETVNLMLQTFDFPENATRQEMRDWRKRMDAIPGGIEAVRAGRTFIQRLESEQER